MTEYKYHYNPLSNIFHFSTVGNITADELLSLWNLFLTNTLIPANCRATLCDFRNISLTESNAAYLKLASHINNSIKSFAQYKIALLIDHPKETACFMLLSKKINAIQTKVFSTKETASEWLK